MVNWLVLSILLLLASLIIADRLVAHILVSWKRNDSGHYIELAKGETAWKRVLLHREELDMVSRPIPHFFVTLARNERNIQWRFGKYGYRLCFRWYPGRKTEYRGPQSPKAWKVG